MAKYNAQPPLQFISQSVEGDSMTTTRIPAGKLGKPQQNCLLRLARSMRSHLKAYSGSLLFLTALLALACGCNVSGHLRVAGLDPKYAGQFKTVGVLRPPVPKEVLFLEGQLFSPPVQTDYSAGGSISQLGSTLIWKINRDATLKEARERSASFNEAIKSSAFNGLEVLAGAVAEGLRTAGYEVAILDKPTNAHPERFLSAKEKQQLPGGVDAFVEFSVDFYGYQRTGSADYKPQCKLDVKFSSADGKVNFGRGYDFFWSPANATTPAVNYHRSFEALTATRQTTLDGVRFALTNTADSIAQDLTIHPTKIFLFLTCPANPKRNAWATYTYDERVSREMATGWPECWTAAPGSHKISVKCDDRKHPVSAETRVEVSRNRDSFVIAELTRVAGGGAPQLKVRLATDDEARTLLLPLQSDMARKGIIPNF